MEKLTTLKTDEAKQVAMNAGYWAVPWKHNECSAEAFAAVALSEVAPKGIIISDSTSYYPLVLVQERDQKETGVTIQSVLENENDCSMVEYRKKILLTGIYVVLPDLTFFPECIRPYIKFTRDENSVLYRYYFSTHFHPQKR